MSILNRCERRFSAAGLVLVMVVGLVVTSWLGVAPALGATLYVRANGDDSSDGSTAATALRTITRATVLARAEDEIVVGPGIYAEGDLRPRVFGRVRFFADRRGVSTGDPPGAVVVDATGSTSGFEINGQLRVSIDGFVIYGASIGIYAKSQSHQAVISNNIVSNCGTNGIYVQDSRDVTVFNNLVYNNGRTGILVTGSIEGSPGAVILSNTVYLNANRGIFFAGTDIGSPRGLVFNNIVRSNGVAGVQVNASSRDGYLSAGNVSFDNRFASGTPIDVTDIDGDPLFVDPAGADGILGGPGYADDSFHLSDRRAGQVSTSAAVDAGTDVARRLSLYRSSTRTDGKYDRRYIDAGYHYGNFDPPPPSPSERIRRRRLYVSTAKGSDVNDGGTRSTAVRTVSRALALARPGNEIRILSGTYREGEIIISTAMSGKPRRPVVVKGMGNVVLDATGAQRGLTLTSVSELIVEGLAVTGALDNGIEVRNSVALNPDDPRSHSVVLRRCRLFGNDKRGLSVRNSTHVAVDACRFEDNGTRGVQIENSDVRIEQSLVRGNGNTGLWAFGGSSVEVIRTDFLDNPDDGVLVEDSALSMAGGTVSGSREGGARFRSKSTGVLDGVTLVGNQDAGIQAVSSSVSLLRSTVRGSRVGVLATIDALLLMPNEVAIEASTICNSVASGVDVQDTTLRILTTTLCSNGRDGLRQSGGSVHVTGSTFEGNASAAIAFTDVVEATLVDVVLADNDSDGLQTQNSDVRIENSFVHNNGRSGLSATGGSTVTIDRTEFLDNLSESLLVRASDVAMYGGTLQGSKEGGARFLALSSGELQNVVIVDNQDVGVQLLSSVVSIAGSTIQRNGIGVLADVDPVEKQRSELSIDDSIVCDSGASGVDVQSTTVNLLGTIVCSNGADGLRQKGGAVDIGGCAFGDNTARGVSVTDASHLNATDVVVARNGNNGLQASNAGIVSMLRSDIFDNRGDGLTVVDSAVRSLVDTRSYRNGSTGILILRNPSGLPALQVSNAHAYQNGQEGFRLSGGSVHFENASFEDNLADGVALTSVEQVTARGMTVARNRSNGFEVAGAQSVSLIDAVLMQNTGDGLTILDSPTSEVSNALVVGNGSTGILISGEAIVSPAARVVGSTVYGNVNRGLLLRSNSATTPSSTKVTVARNIFRHNGNAGIQVNTAPLVDYSGDYNVSTDPYGPQTPVGAHDLLLDPLFVDSAAGNFRLSQQAAGQLVASPAVDAGGMSALAAGMSTLTTRTDGVADAGMVDIGYHYPLPTL